VSKIKIEVINGVEGACLVINNYRVVGPKPWAHGAVIKTWLVDEEDLKVSLENAFKMPMEK